MSNQRVKTAGAKTTSMTAEVSSVLRGTGQGMLSTKYFSAAEPFCVRTQLGHRKDLNIDDDAINSLQAEAASNRQDGQDTAVAVTEAGLLQEFSVGLAAGEEADADMDMDLDMDLS